MKLVRKTDQQQMPYFYWELEDGSRSVEFCSEYTANYWRLEYVLYFWPADDRERSGDPIWKTRGEGLVAV